MRVQILDERYRAVERLEAEPRCGEDFCDDCGDCLHCYAGDSCYAGEGSHLWVVYSDRADDWRADHPEATPR